MSPHRSVKVTFDSYPRSKMIWNGDNQVRDGVGLEIFRIGKNHCVSSAPSPCMSCVYLISSYRKYVLFQFLQCIVATYNIYNL